MVGKVENNQGTIQKNKNNQETTRLKFEISDDRFVNISQIQFHFNFFELNVYY